MPERSGNKENMMTYFYLVTDENKKVEFKKQPNFHGFIDFCMQYGGAMLYRHDGDKTSKTLISYRSRAEKELAYRTRLSCSIGLEGFYKSI